MAKRKKSFQVADRFTPDTKIYALARSKLLDVITGPQFVVLLRVIGAVGTQRTRNVRLTNIELYRDSRTAVRALRELEDMGLIRLRYRGGGWVDRVIEVRR